MPKFLDDKKVLAVGLSSFTAATQMQDFAFTYDDFEKEADELDVQYPGEGYQRAYDKTVMRLFDAYVAKCLRYEDPDISVTDVVYYFDSFVMSSYRTEAKRHGVAAPFVINGKELKLETLKAFDEALERIPHRTPLDETYKKFKRNELTLDSVADDVRARKDTVPSREEALDLVSRAAFLRESYQKRGWRNLFHLPTFFKELLTVNALETLAGKVGNVEALEEEAEVGNVYLAILRERIDTGRIQAQSKAETVRLEEKAARLAANDLSEGEIDLDAPDKTEATFGTLDLGEVDDAFTLEDEESAELNDADLSFREDDEPMKIGDSGEVIATAEERLPQDGAVAGGSDMPDFEMAPIGSDDEPQIVSIVVEELSEAANIAPATDKVESKEAPVKGKAID